MNGLDQRGFGFAVGDGQQVTAPLQFNLGWFKFVEVPKLNPGHKFGQVFQEAKVGGRHGARKAFVSL
jgi:hypothetical protein